MPRSFIEQQPILINKVIEKHTSENILEIATGSKDKLDEYKRLMPNYEIVGIDLKLDEIQSMNPVSVAEKKAISAFEKNGYNPILVEDVSLDIKGLNNKPGPFVTYFVNDPEMRKIIVENWLKDKDRSAIARVILAIHDGTEVFTFVGEAHGTISTKLRGTKGFAFDDMFIPEGQPKGKTKTFAEMNPEGKDKYSMRRKAIEELLKTDFRLGDYILELPEPFESELKRVRKNKINDSKALKFAYKLEAIKGNKPNKEFTATHFEPIQKRETDYYDQYVLDKNSKSIGLVVTDVDKAFIKLHQNGKPILWQMGPERRELALAQRSEYYLHNTSPEIIKLIRKLEKSEFVCRSNKRSPSLETQMDFDFTGTPFNTKSVKELGYKKLSSKKQISRREITKYGLYNKIGKYPRLMYSIGSMPAVSCWRDVILTGIIGQMPVFIARNNIYAGNTQLRIDLINSVKDALHELDIKKRDFPLFERNIGVALGTSNPHEQVKEAKRYYKEAGIKLFRIYGINSDPRFVETAENLRNEFGDEIEIFAGQLVDKRSAHLLLEKANVDGIIFGHGGGRQCTSATNGMALTTVEEVYNLVTDHHFNGVTLMVEGGVGRSVGALFVLGIDGIIYNQQFTRGTIETGGIFLQNKEGNFGQPYHGSASAPTMIIEGANQELEDSRLNYSGRTKVPEGKKGFTLYAEKANSMSFWIDEFKHQLARTMADLGVENINELRSFIASYDKELLRIVSPEATEMSKAYKTKKRG